MTAINLNRSNFEDVVLKSDKPVLIDFWATWCGPCRLQSPIIEELSSELEGSVVVTKLDVDENPELAAQFSVMSIPTIVLIKNGKVVDRKTGVTQKDNLISMINSVRV